MAFDADHKITGLRVKTIANLGGYMSLFSSAVPTYLYATLLSGQYTIPTIYCEVDAVYTNTVPVDAYRGAGRPEATFVVERLMEVAARELSVDPADLHHRRAREVERLRAVVGDRVGFARLRDADGRRAEVGAVGGAGSAFSIGNRLVAS